MAHPALSNMKVRMVGKNHANTDHFCRGKKFSEAPLKEDWLGKEEAIATVFKAAIIKTPGPYQLAWLRRSCLLGNSPSHLHTHSSPLTGF